MLYNRKDFFSLIAAGAYGSAMLNADLSFTDENKPAMKTLGLIGGTSWHSTVDYYRYVNQMVNDELGDKINPPLVLINLNQFEIHRLQNEDKWDTIADIYIKASHTLIKTGAEAIIFCANTPHKNYETIQKRISKPILHIADALGERAKKDNITKLILLGTKFTMTESFIKKRLKEKYNIETVTPGGYSCEKMQQIITEELAMGRIKENSKKFILDEIELLRPLNPGGVILGCTELPMIVEQKDSVLPMLDSTYLHAGAAVRFILSK